MGVSRRTDRKSWVAKSSHMVNGKRPQKSFNDKKYGGRGLAKKEAENWLVKINADILKDRYIDPQKNKITLSKFKDEVGIVKLNQRPKTKEILENTWEFYLAPYNISQIAIGSITPQDIQRHIKSLSKENGEQYSHSTIKKIVEVLRVLFRKAVELEYISKNPATTSIVTEWIPKQLDTKKIYLDKFQVNAIFKDFQEHSPHYAVIIPLLAYTGMRSGEARGLLWSDIDFNEATISITKQFNDSFHSFEDLKTASSVRTIKIPQYVVSYLLDHKESYRKPNSNLVFPDSVHKKPILGKNLKNRHLKPALERLNMDTSINIHTFRHTSVRLARESGADLHAISKRLGHKNITLTADTYSELFENVDAELVNKLDKFINESVG